MDRGHGRYLPEFDAMRVLAALTVIAIHITASYALYCRTAYLLNQLARFAVPLFLIMSGFLLYHAELQKGFPGTGNFYRRRLEKILKPYIVWSLIYTILNAWMAGQAVQELRKIPYHLLWGTAYYHLYFVVIIMQLYLIYPWLRRQTASRPVLLGMASFFITLDCQVLLYFDMLGIYKLPSGCNMFYLVFFPVWIFYFVFGMIMALYREKWEKYLIGGAKGALAVWFLSFMLLLADSYYMQSYAASIRPSVMFYTIGTYFLLYAFLLPRRDLLAEIPFINWFSRQSFFIFLAHPLVIAGLVYVFRYLGLAWALEGVGGMCLMYMLTLLITAAAAYMAGGTPFASYLGAERNR